LGTWGSASSSNGLPLATTRTLPSSRMPRISTSKSLANGGRSPGPGRTTTLYPRVRYRSATMFSRCSLFMASPGEWKWVYRVFDPDVHELISGLESCHNDRTYAQNCVRRADLCVGYLSLDDLPIVVIDD